MGNQTEYRMKTYRQFEDHEIPEPVSYQYGLIEDARLVQILESRGEGKDISLVLSWSRNENMVKWDKGRATKLEPKPVGWIALCVTAQSASVTLMSGPMCYAVALRNYMDILRKWQQGHDIGIPDLDQAIDETIIELP